MPDSKEHNWVPDEGFWNEAWTDMEDRLVRRKRRRALLVWLGILLPVLVAGTLVLRNAPATFTPEVEPTPAAAASAAPVVAEKEEPTFVPTGKQAQVTAAGSLPEPSAERPSPAGVIITGEPTAPALAAPLPYEAGQDISTNLPPSAVASIATLGPFFLPVGTTLPDLRVELPTVKADCPAPPALQLSAGTNVYAGSWRPGGYGSLAYRWGKGKWSFPLEARYVYSRREFQLNAESYGEALADFAAGGTPQLSTGGFASSLRSAIADSGFESVRTHEIELRAGVGRKLGSCGRFYLSGGLGLSYLLSGQGPALYTTSGGNTTFDVREERLNAGGTSGSANFSPTAGNFPLDTEVNRFTPSVWLRADWWVAKRWGVSVGATRQLGPLYRSSFLDAGQTRLAFGLSHRL
ncbi:hypothetical protein [Lewinella sp. JB7]|uniref:hypothetical protein n=1 Tax=Lewinella sp. JB7 TaxID=2962887 RepID=UPI0020CA17DE|nr:hypothetical protein [Lewinella sp. JB7]MCP9235517.1 hypothetical protein [Lewinella sp. JB7]